VKEEPQSPEIGNHLSKQCFQDGGGASRPDCLLCRHDIALTGRFGGYFKLRRTEGHMFISLVRISPSLDIHGFIQTEFT
jgi:hypothetical protein